MKTLLDLIPLILFFVVYKFVGVREAGITLTLATLIQLAILKWHNKKIEKQTLIMGIAVIFFASLTAYFNDLHFLKWKVTLVYALFALILLISQYIFHKNLMQDVLGKELSLPDNIWKKINLAWASFFLLCMGLNLYISHTYSDDIWVKFKTFGILGLTLIATLITGAYAYRYLPENQQKGKEK